MANTAQTLSPQQRANLFGQSTRQHIQMLPKQTANTGSATLQFHLPKSRLLSKLMVDVVAKVKIAHATETTIPTPTFAPFQLIRRISLDLNNGFSPFVIDGRSLAMYNMVRLNPAVIIPQKDNSRGMNYLPDMVASVAGTDNTFKFTMELPVTLNPRDPVGLILLQNDQTNVTLTADLVNGAEIFNSPAGYVISVQSVDMSVATETFSVPPIDEAFPDISVLKLVSSRLESFVGGPAVIKFLTGNIYRKIVLYFEHSDGTPYTDDEITANMELVFNQADIPYSVTASALAHKNENDLGYALPTGMYVFDFTNQGIPNLGGSRDLVDTEKLTEFWLKFSTANGGKVTVISETLTRMK